MLNKNKLYGKSKAMMGKLADNPRKKYHGMAQNKLGELQSKASDMAPDHMSQQSMFSLAVGVLLIASGLFFVFKAKDDLF
ncbi:MAG TPA: hypothetical protein VK048_00440 [Atopostipes sp.]|nr:hypothetical protein [Atopostipes sp.]